MRRQQFSSAPLRSRATSNPVHPRQSLLAVFAAPCIEHAASLSYPCISCRVPLPSWRLPPARFSGTGCSVGNVRSHSSVPVALSLPATAALYRSDSSGSASLPDPALHPHRPAATRGLACTPLQTAEYL